jgi:hypothetical protein
MTVAALLSDLSASGVAVRIDHAGQLKASGDQDALARLLPQIRAHKAHLLAVLAANDAEPQTVYRLFDVIRPDGTALSVSRTPPCTLAEIEADYPGATVEPEPAPPPAAALHPDDLAVVYALLRRFGEDDTTTGLEWIEGLARDPERLEQMRQMALSLGLARWEEPPATPTRETPRQMAVCARCRHFQPSGINPPGGLGQCLTGAPASRRAGSLWPWLTDAEIHCPQFEDATHE